ncbi:MAG TPA: SPOR domain-containing protein [Burkholderiales bacterium]|nr:SPOR domain-containing protein [Burkholderiales bacterium]
MSRLPARGIHGVPKEFMAKAVSDEELQLRKRARRRLVGAVALVLLIVVFLPMILDNEPRPLNQDITITIPPIPKPEPTRQMPASALPGAPATSRVAGLPEGTPAAQPDPAPSVEPKPEPQKSELPRTEARPAPKSAKKHEVKAAPAGSAAGEESFVVQLGAFSNAANARALQKKLQDNKFSAYTELVKNAAGDRTRVRVGPYAGREAAEKARDRLKAMKLIIGEAAVVRRD